MANASGDTGDFARTSEEVALATAVADLVDPVLITRGELSAPGPTIVALSRGFVELSGYSAGELVGKNPRLLQGPLTDRAVLDQLRRACERGEHWIGETVNYRKNGTPYVLQWTIDPIRDPNGQITHFFSLQRDVTAERPFAERWLDAEQQTRAAHEALGRHMRAIAEAILVLEQTKRNFHSKQLGELRQRLVQFARGQSRE